MELTGLRSTVWRAAWLVIYVAAMALVTGWDTDAHLVLHHCGGELRWETAGNTSILIAAIPAALAAGIVFVTTRPVGGRVALVTSYWAGFFSLIALVAKDMDLDGRCNELVSSTWLGEISQDAMVLLVASGPALSVLVVVLRRLERRQQRLVPLPEARTVTSTDGDRVAPTPSKPGAASTCDR
jgi:hypothetical protein